MKDALRSEHLVATKRKPAHEDILASKTSTGAPFHAGLRYDGQLRDGLQPTDDAPVQGEVLADLKDVAGAHGSTPYRLLLSLKLNQPQIRLEM